MRKSASWLAVALLAWALAVTVARAARYPNDFSLAHWMLDYQFGFIKRGLVGSLVALLTRVGLVTPDGQVIAWASFVIFGVLCAMLLAVAGRILARSGWSADAYLALAAFMTSAFVVTAAHLVGYFDHIVYLLTFGALWCVLRGRSWAAGVLGLAAVLVHESFMVVGYPLMVLATGMQAGKSLRRLWLPLALPVVAFLAVIVSEAFFVDPGLLRQRLSQHLVSFPFIGGDMHLLVPEWLTTTTAQNLQQHAHRFLERAGDGLYLWHILPSALPLWLLAIGALGRRRGAIWAAPMAAAMGAPLLLHLVAWDTARIWTYVQIAALGCAWIAYEQGPRRRSWPLPLIGLLACPAIYWNLFKRYPLLDYLSERFTDSQRMLYYAPFLVGSLIVVGMMVVHTRGGTTSSPDQAS